jgi:DNA (cytosine-5)-methyltransferase 1
MFSGIGGFEKGIEDAFKSRDCVCSQVGEGKDGQQSENECLSHPRIDSVCEHNAVSCIGFSEIDKNAINIYLKHYPGHKNYGDANAIRTDDLPSFDFLVGGFPCQAFSIAGKRGGFDDTRGTLFFEIARILADKKPGQFLLENVKGLLSHDEGRTFKVIISTLAEMGYCVEWEVLNSKNFGVPQNRERVFIHGFREGCGRQIFPLGTINGEIASGVGQAQEDPIIHGTVTGAIGRRGSSSEYLDSLKKVKEASKIIDPKYLMRDCTITDICPTMAKRDYKEPFIVAQEGYKIRRLTPVECERLQGFPDDWTKYGADGKTMSDSARYKACGNAVTTNVIRAIIEATRKSE